MLVQKRREQLKAYEKQEKRIKDMKASGATKKQAVSTLLFSKYYWYIVLYIRFYLTSCSLILTAFISSKSRKSLKTTFHKKAELYSDTALKIPWQYMKYM